MSATDLVDFLNASLTPWHAVAEVRRRLEAAGYRELGEGDAWTLRAGDKVFVVRAGTTIAAFELGTEAPETGGFHLIGAHTDSPNLRLKPQPFAVKSSQHVAGVEPYGGVLLHTWLDRDLILAGRVFRRGADRPALIATAPIARVPSLAIHLDRGVNTDGLKLNPQTQLPPVLGLESGGALGLANLVPGGGDAIGFDLAFVDAQPAAIVGARGEYVMSGRLDNLASCHAALTALLACEAPGAHTRGVVLYDHEECGSQSAQGAQSAFLRDVLARLVHARGGSGVDALPRATHHSFFVSADMAHAIHPSYADKHEPAHAPIFGGGPVIKVNVNQRYATDGESAARFAGWCEAAGVAFQRFVTRSDLACGSTIGPITAALLGMRTVDVGNPMLSMHSAREMCAAADVPAMIAALGAFLRN
ncbi:MAG: M18 family aminopeptidase [Deltaproteobacteria bacterium]|nr:M18 family aminopeptidase [Deltaproteobacteria bacterium]